MTQRQQKPFLSLGLSKILSGCLILLIAGFFTSHVFAQTNNQAPPAPSINKLQNTGNASFAGFYSQVGLGYQSFTPSFSDTRYSVGNTTYGISTDASTAQGVTGMVTLGYYYPVSPDFLLGVGADLTPVASQSVSIGGATVGNVPIPSSTYKINNSYNLFVSMLFPVDKATSFYGKLGYNKANASYGPNSDSLGYSGYSFGLGYKSYISGNFFAYIEANYVNYGKVDASGTAYIPGTSSAYNYSNSSTASSYNILYGVGITF